MKELRRNEWVSVNQAAQRLATNPMRIYQWVHRYAVPKRGNGYLFLALERIEFGMRHPELKELIDLSG